MADICIFYSEPDEYKVNALSSVLENLGWSVWWDKDITNGRWGPEIEKNIKNARCVIPIWNNHAIRAGSITFVEAETSRKLNKPMITLVSEEIEPPFPFGAEHITSNISGWECNADADCVDKIVKSAESILGIAPKKWKDERPSIINLLGKQIKIPCFVKSLSSHETQFDTEAGLSILNVFPDVDALLVSAYDMHLRDDPDAKPEDREKQWKKHEFMHEKLKVLDERGALIFLDSGNYEKSRKEDKTWDKKKLELVLENTHYTYAFCYDELYPVLDVHKNVEDVIAHTEGKYEDVLLPILHAPIDDNGVRVHNLLPDIFVEYTSRKTSPLIAVPERELGEGICEKAKTIIKIRKRLNKLDRYQPIHILGTGNPLSLLILAAAGADFFDGLEWCRTVADKKTGFLFHHQQFDFFKNQTINNPRYPLIKEVLERDDVSLTLKMGLHNLEFFLEWMEQLQTGINTNSIREMIKDRAVFGTHDFVDELKNLMPGLFK
ncbi:MAG: toll/interleukin-1 receptor domain-containing protein [Deltaproteobacteria bacterium]|nr:toll/interleukin-1 receptor domain-containing protein [Deltaproteobacteria bacterium]